jgi:hypothetical protein
VRRPRLVGQYDHGGNGKDNDDVGGNLHHRRSMPWRGRSSFREHWAISAELPRRQRPPSTKPTRTSSHRGSTSSCRGSKTDNAKDPARRMGPWESQGLNPDSAAEGWRHPVVERFGQAPRRNSYQP